MQVLDILRRAHGGATIDNLAKTFDLPPESAEAVLAQVMPELTFAMERNTLSRRGVADLIEALGSGHHARYAEDPAMLTDPEMREDGNRILGHILGGKAESRKLAARAAADTGISATIIKAMLPYIASLLMGALSKSAQGGIGDILKRLPQLGGGSARPQISADPIPLPLPGAGGAVAGQNYGASPLPLPDDSTIGRGRTGGNRGNNPYRDLGDVLRRGGSSGNGLWKTLRGLLGGILGFQSRGMMGWLFRLIVMRYGWRILKFVFARFFRFR